MQVLEAPGAFGEGRRDKEAEIEFPSFARASGILRLSLRNSFFFIDIFPPETFFPSSLFSPLPYLHPSTTLLALKNAPTLLVHTAGPKGKTSSPKTSTNTQ